MVLSALRHHETCLRRDPGTVVPLKFGRLDNLHGVAAIWGLAAYLLTRSEAATRGQTELRLLTKASVGAIWALLPLRLNDGQTIWGRDVRIDDTRYRVDIETRTEIALRNGR